MAFLAAFGGLSFLLICIVGGARLLLLARRTRKLPEFVLGMGLFLLGGIGTPLGAVARAPTDLSLDLRAGFLVAHCTIMVIGMGGFNAFTCQVFRPQEMWARSLAWAFPLVMLSGMAWTHFGSGFVAELATMGPGSLIQQLGVLATLSWAAWESLRYAAILKRRLALGLVDPVVFDRVRLWGVAMGLAVVLTSAAVGGHLMGISVIGTVAGAAFVGCVGFIAGSAIYLAFLPPQAYTSWVIARFGAGAGA